jgi:hypothetical protein
MRRIALGIFFLVLSCGLLQAEADKRMLVGAHMGLVVPSLSRIEENEELDDWRYDIGWGIDFHVNVIGGIVVAAQYDMFPIRYHGLADRSDVKGGELSGQYGLLHHITGEALYNFVQFDHSFVFIGGSFDYLYADQTVNGSYLEGEAEEEVFYTDTFTLDKATFGIPAGLTSYWENGLGFTFRVKPVFYYWSDESLLQFVSVIGTITFGYAF